MPVISFTGSTETGSKIGEVCGRMHKRLSLEMGGKNAMIVMDDADLDLALDGVLWGAFGTTGQRCTATSRLILQDGSASMHVGDVGGRGSNRWRRAVGFLRMLGESLRWEACTEEERASNRFVSQTGFAERDIPAARRFADALGMPGAFWDTIPSGYAAAAAPRCPSRST